MRLNHERQTFYKNLVLGIKIKLRAEVSNLKSKTIKGLILRPFKGSSSSFALNIKLI